MKLQELASILEQNGEGGALRDVVTDGVGNILRVTVSGYREEMFRKVGYLLNSETETEQGEELATYIPQNEQRDAYIVEELCTVEQMGRGGVSAEETVLRLCSVVRSLQDSLREQREEARALIEMIEDSLQRLSR